MKIGNRSYRYIYGLDPASKMDYFGIVVHALPSKPNAVPFVIDLQAITHTSYLNVMMALKTDLFVKYPPYYMVVDYNTEKTFTQILVRDFGKERVEAMNFGNSTKQQLKDDGLAILKQGYQFSDPMSQKNMDKRRLMIILIKQLKQEQMLQTPGGQFTYDHPSGEHNDLAIAWELSVHGCLKYMINSIDGPVAVGSKKTYNSRGWGLPDSAEDPSAEIKLNVHNRIRYEDVHQET